MADIKDYGELYTSDILVVGGGMAGLVTAIRAKENDPTLDILVIDKGIIGWNGQATKAGNGIRSTSKHPNGVKNALEYLVMKRAKLLRFRLSRMHWIWAVFPSMYVHSCVRWH